MAMALQGLVVLDLTNFLSGPYCTMLLGDMGADVIKVERPGTGDDARRMPPFVDGRSAPFSLWNRNKRSIVLDMKVPADAEALRRRLADRAFVRHLADWLQQRPQLGREVFARGAAEEPEGADRGAAPAADTAALLRACLAVLERPDRGGAWRPAQLPLWRVPDALARLRRMLPAVPPEGAALERFLPEMAEDQSGDGMLRRRAALASTLLAGLELSREGSAAMGQEQAFGRIVVAPAATSSR